MESQKMFLALIFSLFTFQICFGQETPKAVKIDEFGRITCEDLSARIDNLFNEIADNSNSAGYAIIYGSDDNLFKNLRYESWINGHWRNRKFDERRLKVIRGAKGKEIRIELWKVPANAEEPSYSESEWSYALPNSTKAFIFTAYTWQDGLCSSTSYVKLFADFLLANPKATGHLVIRDRTNKNFQNIEKQTLDELTNQYKVSRNRLKLFYVEDKNYTYNYADVEFWFVPQKKK